MTYALQANEHRPSKLKTNFLQYAATTAVFKLKNPPASHLLFKPLDNT